MKSKVIYEPSLKAWIPADKDEYLLLDVCEASRKGAIKQLYEQKKTLKMRLLLAKKCLSAPVKANNWGYFLDQMRVPNKVSVWLYEFLEEKRPHFGEHRDEAEMATVLKNMKEKIKLYEDIIR